MSTPTNLSTEHTPAAPVTARTRKKLEGMLGTFYPSKGNVPAWILATAGFVFILVVFKILPGHAPSAQYLMSDATFAECFHKARTLGIDGCLNFGFPKGAPKTFGLPVSIIGSYLAKDGSVSLSSILLVYAGFLLVAYLSAIALFKRIVGFTWLAIVGVLLFMGSITVHKFMEYGALGLGIALIPFYLLVDLRFLDSLSGDSRFKSMAWFAAVVAARCLAIFLDGYSFLFSCLLSVTCLFFMPVFAKRYKVAAITCAAYLLACGLAAAAYKTYFPSDALGSTPISGFRAQGVDVYGLISPQPDSIYYKTLGIGENIDPLVTYSDGSSSRGIFLGYAWMISAFLIILFLARNRAKIEARYVVPIVLAGLAGLVLSLGPSLKFKSFRDVPATSITSSHYDMPESAAVMSLPTAWIYQKVPGVKTARALVRWLVLTQFAISILIVMAVLILLQNRKVVLALALTGLALLELLPDFPYYLDGGRFTYARAHTLYYDYPASLKAHVKSGDRALFVELHDNPGGNQYTVNTLCTRTSIFCYNNGGDKASAVVQRHWPTDILDARNRRHTRIAIERIFQSNLADVVIVPFFDLKLSTYSEAQGAVDKAKVVQSARSLADSLGLALQVGDRYAFIRPRAVTRDAGHADACSISCWRSWPDLALPVPQWGPKKTAAGQPINQQSDGQSLIWVKIVDPDRNYSLALGDTILSTQSNKQIVAGSVPRTLIESFIPGASYPLYLLDTESKKKLLLGHMRIARPGA